MVCLRTTIKNSDSVAITSEYSIATYLKLKKKNLWKCKRCIREINPKVNRKPPHNGPDKKGKKGVGNWGQENKHSCSEY